MTDEVRSDTAGWLGRRLLLITVGAMAAIVLLIVFVGGVNSRIDGANKDRERLKAEVHDLGTLIKAADTRIAQLEDELTRNGIAVPAVPTTVAPPGAATTTTSRPPTTRTTRNAVGPGPTSAPPTTTHQPSPTTTSTTTPAAVICVRGIGCVTAPT